MRYLRKLAIGGIIVLFIFPLVTCSSNGTDSSNQPPSEPAAVAPPDGAGDITTTPTLRWSSVDPDGDAVYFDVYIGTDNNPPLVATDNPTLKYITSALDYSTTYYWKIVSKDHIGGTAASPVWSFTTKAFPPEVVTTPTTPLGESGGRINTDLIYTTGGSVSSYGNAVEYRFNWGDGNYSDWSSSTSGQHTWTTVGIYAIKAQARSAVNTDIVSEWSNAKNISLNDLPEEISRPNEPAGPDVIPVDQSFAYSTGGAVSNQGHIVEYRFDWGDGEISDWSTSTIASHTWTLSGIVYIKAQARCATHTDVVSEWSPSFLLIVYQP